MNAQLIRTKIMIRITKIFHFEAAHLLKDYDGPCKNIHGHSYELHVTVMGLPITNLQSPKNGMVIEFSDFKEIIDRLIVKELDHSLILPESVNPLLIKTLKDLDQKIVIKKFQPTCENLLYEFAEIISKNLPTNVKLKHIKLFETRSSYAEWDIADQTRI